MLRTLGDPVSLWESLPAEVLRLPEQLARVDALLDDPAFFAPFVPFFSLTAGRPPAPMECYLRMMFLKFRYRLGFESLCAEVSDSTTWRRFCRIPLDGKVPHPTTLMKLTTRCGTVAAGGLNEALLAKAAQAKLLRTSRLRADTTVVPANVCYPTDSGLLAKAIRRIAATGRRIQAAGGATRTRVRDRSRSAGKRAHAIASKLGLRGAQRRDEARATVTRVTGELAGLAGRAARDAARLLANARRALRRAQAKAAGLAAAGLRDPAAGGGGDGYAARSMTWPDCWTRPSGSPPRSGSGSPGSPRTARPGGSACTTPTPGRSPRAASASPPSSAAKAMSPTTTTASCWTTTWSRATRPAPRSSLPLSTGSFSARARRRGQSPPTAATARKPSTTTRTRWACAP